MPAPKAPEPPPCPSDAAAFFKVSMRKTSPGAVCPVLSQNNRSRYSGVVSIPSNLRSVNSMPTRLK